MQSAEWEEQIGDAAYMAADHTGNGALIKTFPERITPNTRPVYLFAKRAFDVLASGIALFILSPVMLATALAIKIEDPKGTVFYNAPRSGKDGIPFTCHKFRSMCHSADEDKARLMNQNEMDGPVFKMRDDPRVTKVGHFIRRTSIDELPQLWDVFRGKMSLVGPRPLPVAEEMACNPYQRQRELVKPGLTCYWQVSGRSDVPFHEWIELDRKYIKEQNIRTDVRILVKTIPAVFSGRGGY